MTKEISIHAPARGATREVIRYPDRKNFNPRTRTGCDMPSAIADSTN